MEIDDVEYIGDLSLRLLLRLGLHGLALPWFSSSRGADALIGLAEHFSEKLKYEFHCSISLSV